MQRRDFLKLISATVPFMAGCAYRRIDLNHVLLRSDIIDSLEKEKEILAKARLGMTDDGRIRVLYLKGTPYEQGYQHGALLRREVQDNLGYMYEQARKRFLSEEFFAEVYERSRPFIPQDYIDEMQGLAHGAKMPLHVIHHIHALPEATEWGGKKKMKEVAKAMMRGDLGTSCSNFSAIGSATSDGQLYVVRILDWGLHKISKLHEYPLITVARPTKGHAYANIGWVGFLGAISGMNSEGITLGEMGYGDPPGETLRGKPMPFLLRDVLSSAANLNDVRRILKESPGTNSFGFLMSDGKVGKSELYIKDRNRFLVFEPGQEVTDGSEHYPPIKDMCYGGHFRSKMTELMQAHHGELSPDLFMKMIIPQLAMKSNFQDVVYAPKELKFWVSNAKGSDARAAEQPYTFFDFGKALREFST